MIQKLKYLWASLPHPVQALILAFATAAGTALLQSVSEGYCFSLVCLKHDLAGAALAGVAAARTFYMLPSNKAALVNEAKAIVLKQNFEQ